MRRLYRIQDPVPGTNFDNGDEPESCTVCFENKVIKTSLPCGHSFCFLCAKGSTRSNRCCPLCRAPIPSNYLQQDRSFLEEPLIIPVDPEQYQWFYQGRTGWWLYESRDSEIIEQQYQLDAHSKFEQVISGTIYVIDFEQMVQYAKHNPTQSRTIKRDIVDRSTTLGVAGVRGTFVARNN